MQASERRDGGVRRVFRRMCKLALRHSTALRALGRRLRRLVKDGSAVSGGGPKLWGCRELKLKNRLYLRLTCLFRAESVLAAALHLFLPSLSKISAARRDCGELADLQAKACAANRSRSSGRERLRIQHVAHGREIARAALLLDRTPHCSPDAPVAEAPKPLHQCTERHPEREDRTPRTPKSLKGARSATPSRARGLHAENTPSSADTSSDRSPARLRRYQTRR